MKQFEAVANRRSPQGAAAAMLAFLRGESAGGAALILAALVALVWSNSPAAPVYAQLLGTRLGTGGLAMPLHAWVNDGLMAVFFLLVGLEIRREMTDGHLASLRSAAAPGIAALGGMIVPAAICAALTWRDPAVLRGWAVPMATDIAFSLAVLSLLGRRVPTSLKVFLTALAIIDDLGAIVVIAIFYTTRLDPVMLAAAAGAWLGMLLMNRAGVRRVTPYLLGATLLWWLVLRSGVHATLAGVATAFVLPARPTQPEVPGVAARVESGVHPWVAFLILPLFGLANAGLPLDTLPRHLLADPLVIGIAAGLVIGKPVGVFGATWLALRSGLARLPPALTPCHLAGGAILCGIGFTMSLFIGELAFRGGTHMLEVKLAVFAASLLSALLGLIVLALPNRARPTRPASGGTSG